MWLETLLDFKTIANGALFFSALFLKELFVCSSVFLLNNIWSESLVKRVGLGRLVLLKLL